MLQTRTPAAQTGFPGPPRDRPDCHSALLQAPCMNCTQARWLYKRDAASMSAAWETNAARSCAARKNSRECWCAQLGRSHFPQQTLHWQPRAGKSLFNVARPGLGSHRVHSQLAHVRMSMVEHSRHAGIGRDAPRYNSCWSERTRRYLLV